MRPLAGVKFFDSGVKTSFFWGKDRFPAKLNHAYLPVVLALYRTPSLIRIGDKRFSSFPRGDPREIEKFDPR